MFFSVLKKETIALEDYYEYFLDYICEPNANRKHSSGQIELLDFPTSD